MLSCPQCGRESRSGRKVCPHDGARLVPGQSESDRHVGKVLGDKFKVEERLGAGGMGEVYRAFHIHLDRTVALKLLSPHLATDKTAHQRFMREARVVSQLENPHTVKVFEFGKLEIGPLYLAMEYIEGEPLDAIIQRGPMPWPRALNVLDGVCESLAEAHALGVVHRDIKPPNIFIQKDRDGEDFAKVLDFGLAKIDSHSVEISRQGAIIGTPSYLAPEQAISDKIDHRADIYALGVLLFEMLTTARPFESDALHVLVFKHVHEQPPRIRAAHPSIDIPESIDELVHQMLAKSVEDRPQTVQEIQAAVAFALQQAPEISGSHSTRRQVPDTYDQMPSAAAKSRASSRTAEQADSSDTQRWDPDELPADLVNELAVDLQGDDTIPAETFAKALRAEARQRAKADGRAPVMRKKLARLTQRVRRVRWTMPTLHSARESIRALGEWARGATWRALLLGIAAGVVLALLGKYLLLEPLARPVARPPPEKTADSLPPP